MKTGTNISQPSDIEIIDLIKREGKKQLFSVLYDRYHQQVYGKCRDMVKNSDVARELTQEIFSRTFEVLGTFRGDSAFSSWLYSITYNKCIDYLRIKKKMSYPDWNEQNEIPQIIDYSEELNEESITPETLYGILDKIHPEEKALILMKYMDGLSIDQICRSLRISPSAAKMRLKRAKARIHFIYNKSIK